MELFGGIALPFWNPFTTTVAVPEAPPPVEASN
jgi:hypothetical protein